MSEEETNNQNLYKYRVGNSWFTFDKSVLAPEDLRVFELANWRDKLKIITIYKDLKQTDDDDVVILRTKTEDSTKDVRRRQYNEQKEALEKELNNINEWYDKSIKSASTDATRQSIVNTYEEKIRDINNKLSSLDSSFADVIMVKRIDALDSKKSNRLMLKNVKDILEGADKTLNELKTTLKAGDFKMIESIFKDTLQAETKGQLSENIDLINNAIKDIRNSNTLENNIVEKLHSLENSMGAFKTTLAASNEYIDFVINKIMDTDFKTRPFIQKVAIVSNLIDEAGVDYKDIKTIWDYPLAFGKIQKMQKKDKFKYITVYGNLIRLYNDLTENEGQDIKFKINISTNQGKDKEEIMKSFGVYPILKENEIYKYTTGKKDYKSIGKYLLCPVNKEITNSYKEIDDIVSDKKIYTPTNDELETTGGLFSFSNGGLFSFSNGGLLGLRTNKQAKKDFDYFNERIDKILDQQNKILEKLEQTLELQKVQEPKQQTVESSKPDESYSQPVIEDKLNLPYFQDIRNQPRLKHIEPTKQAPELTELQKTFIKRREQMGYTDDDDMTVSDDEVWADGVDDSDLHGGLLEELVEDLKRYGLALSLAPDEKAYFLNVYEKGKTKPRRKGKKAAAGVAEADTLVKSVNQDTEYKDLKKLYEQLY